MDVLVWLFILLLISVFGMLIAFIVCYNAFHPFRKIKDKDIDKYYDVKNSYKNSRKR